MGMWRACRRHCRADDHCRLREGCHSRALGRRLCDYPLRISPPRLGERTAVGSHRRLCPCCCALTWYILDQQGPHLTVIAFLCTRWPVLHNPCTGIDVEHLRFTEGRRVLNSVV